MQPMPRQAVIAAAGVLAFAALAGAAFGVSHGISQANSQGEEAGPIVPAVTPVASAKPILTPAPSLDETEVRKIAREEAEGVLARSEKRAQAQDEADDAAEPEQLTPVSPVGTPTGAAHPPAIGQPPPS